ncbi:hypothetical protein C8J57DRAFT_665799 [Mycena rebaudengoi]|nr:hypothetical protein C8J57DRAFT_665799 [Mycena rebaudengoi]
MLSRMHPNSWTLTLLFTHLMHPSKSFTAAFTKAGNCFYASFPFHVISPFSLLVVIASILLTLLLRSSPLSSVHRSPVLSLSMSLLLLPLLPLRCDHVSLLSVTETFLFSFPHPPFCCPACYTSPPHRFTPLVSSVCPMFSHRQLFSQHTDYSLPARRRAPPHCNRESVYVAFLCLSSAQEFVAWVFSFV